jgi:hypothetical protein
VNIFQNTKWKPEYAIELNNSLTYLKIWKRNVNSNMDLNIELKHKYYLKLIHLNIDLNINLNMD